MVDFAKLKADAKANMMKAKPLDNKPSELDRITHLIAYHLSEMTEWETGFLYSQKQWLTAKSGNYLSAKGASKLKEIEDMYCGKDCTKDKHG